MFEMSQQMTNQLQAPTQRPPKHWSVQIPAVAEAQQKLGKQLMSLKICSLSALIAAVAR